MSSACTPILVGVVSPVSEIKLAYSPWSLKNLINLNRLKKFMQVGIECPNACTPILVGVVSPVSEIKLA